MRSMMVMVALVMSGGCGEEDNLVGARQVAWECSPGDKRCVAESRVQKCDEDGQWGREISFICVYGECIVDPDKDAFVCM